MIKTLSCSPVAEWGSPARRAHGSYRLQLCEQPHAHRHRSSRPSIHPNVFAPASWLAHQHSSPDSSSPDPAWTVEGTHPAKSLDAAGAPVFEHQLVRAAPRTVHSLQHHIEQSALRNDVRETSHLRCPHSCTLNHSRAHLPVVLTWPADLGCEEKSGQPSAGVGPPHYHPRLNVFWTWTGQAEVRQPCQEQGGGTGRPAPGPAGLAHLGVPG